MNFIGNSLQKNYIYILVLSLLTSCDRGGQVELVVDKPSGVAFEGGDGTFWLVDAGKRRSIPDTGSLICYGFSLTDLRSIDDAELQRLTLGVPLKRREKIRRSFDVTPRDDGKRKILFPSKAKLVSGPIATNDEAPRYIYLKPPENGIQVQLDYSNLNVGGVGANMDITVELIIEYD